MVTKISIRCPCCGMFAYLDSVKALERVDLQTFEKSLGGRIPRSLAEGYTKKHGTAGILTFEEISDPALLEEVKALWRRRLEAASAVLRE
jgi:hypothetical protein